MKNLKSKFLKYLSAGQAGKFLIFMQPLEQIIKLFWVWLEKIMK